MQEVENEGKLIGPFVDKLDEVRNGLQCGDMARAGFVASIVASMGEENEQPSLADVEYAVGWANWFGMQKIRFFTLEDYLTFLKSDDVKTWLHRHLKRRKNKKIFTRLRPSDAPEDVMCNFVFKNACKETTLCKGLKQYRDTAYEMLGTDRNKWQKTVDAWYKARRFGKQK